MQHKLQWHLYHGEKYNIFRNVFNITSYEGLKTTSQTIKVNEGKKCVSEQATDSVSNAYSSCLISV